MGYTGEIHRVIRESLGYSTTLESTLESTANEIFYIFAGVTSHRTNIDIMSYIEKVRNGAS